MANQKKRFSFSAIVQRNNGKKKHKTESRKQKHDDLQEQTHDLTSKVSKSKSERKRMLTDIESQVLSESLKTAAKRSKKTKPNTCDDSEEVILVSAKNSLAHGKRKKDKMIANKKDQTTANSKTTVNLDENKDNSAVVIDVDAPDTNVIEIPDDDVVLVSDEEMESCDEDVINIESDSEVKQEVKYRRRGKRKMPKDKGSSKSKGRHKKAPYEHVVQNQSTYNSMDDERLNCVRLEDSVLLILDHPYQLALSGCASVQSLLGSIQVMGYELDSSHSEVDIYSPTVGSSLTISTQSSGTNKAMVIDHLKQLGEVNWKKLEDILEQRRSPVIIQIKNSKSHMCGMKMYSSPFSQLFRTKESGLFSEALQPLGVCVSDIEDSHFPCVKVGEDLQSLLMEWNSNVMEYSKKDKKPPVIVICGARNTGKSTTNRILINNALNSLDCVYFLDCDIGQSEFTPPGCVSLIKVTEPVLGPPFTHQRKPESSIFFGGVTPTNNPDSYIRCLIQCVQFYTELEKCAPLIVNTMGWIEDLGLQLLIDTVRLVAPTHIVQLQAKPGDEMIDKLFECPSWTDSSSIQFPKCGLSQKTRAPKCLYIKPRPNNREFKPSNARELRDLTVLGYFYQNLEPGLTLYSVSPYCVKLKDVAVHVFHTDVPQSQTMYALNASLVALCHADLTKTKRPYEDGPLFFDEVPVFEWKGYGIVRGIDMEKKVLYIITPLTSDELQEVNSIVKGSVLIPEQVLLNKSLTSPPYVDGRISSFGDKELKPKKRPKKIGRPK